MDRVRAAVDAGRIPQPVTVVLEGKARQGAASGVVGSLTIVHADRSGDDALIGVIESAAGQPVTLVTADRELRRRAESLGAAVVGPGWLLEILGCGRRV